MTYTKEGKTYKNIDGEWVEVPLDLSEELNKEELHYA